MKKLLKKKHKISKMVSRGMRTHKQYGPDTWGFIKTTLYYKSGRRRHMIWSPRFHRFKKYFKKKGTRKRFMLYFKLKSFYTKLCVKSFLYFQKRREKWFARKLRYIYTLNAGKPKLKRKRLSDQFRSLRISRLYYVILKYKQFKRMARKAKKKDGFFEPNYLILLEGRVSSIIYRVNFSSNLFEALKVARFGVIWFNKKFRSRANFVVSLMKFVGLHFLFKGFVYYNLVRRLIKKSVLQGFPKYIFMSYIFLTFFFKRLPRLKDYINPIPIDLYRATGYAV